MGEFTSFREYLDHKKKLVTTPKKEKVPDYSGPNPASPEKPAESGKNWKAGTKHKGKPAPYRAPGTDPGQRTADGKDKGKGFADMGDDDLVYEPDAGDVDKAGEGGKKLGTWPSGPKTKTEAWLAKTRKLSLPDFAKEVRKGILEHCGCENKKAPHVVAYSVGAYHPDPIQAINYVVYLTNENQNILRALMMEAKRHGCLNKYVNQLLLYPETYQALVEALSDKQEGASINNRLTKALNDHYRHKVSELSRIYGEETAPPMHIDDEEEDDTGLSSPEGDEDADDSEGDDLDGDSEGDEMSDPDLGDDSEGEGDDTSDPDFGNDSEGEGDEMPGPDLGGDEMSNDLGEPGSEGHMGPGGEHDPHQKLKAALEKHKKIRSMMSAW